MTHVITRLAAAILVVFCPAAQVQAADPLPSWNEGATKQSIIDFVSKGDQGRRAGLRRRRRSASPPSTMTARCGSSSRYFQFVFAIDG